MGTPHPAMVFSAATQLTTQNFTSSHGYKMCIQNDNAFFMPQGKFEGAAEDFPSTFRGNHVGHTTGLGSYGYRNIPCGRAYSKYAGEYDSHGLTFDVYFYKQGKFAS